MFESNKFIVSILFVIAVLVTAFEILVAEYYRREGIEKEQYNNSYQVSTTPIVDPNRITTETLINFDGEGENPCYVALDGVIYEIENSDEWGEESPCGRDVSEIIDIEPLSRSKLSEETVRIVGRLQDY